VRGQVAILPPSRPGLATQQAGDPVGGWPVERSSGMRRMVLSSTVIVFGLVTAVMVAGTVLAQRSSTATNNPTAGPSGHRG